jgi:hypothetical protein
MQFQDDLAAGVVLVRPAFQSPDYVPGSSGWAVLLDGSAEFNNVVIRGGTTVSGTAPGPPRGISTSTRAASPWNPPTARSG